MLADHQISGDLAVGLARGDEPEYLALPLGEDARLRGRNGLDPSQVDRGAQRLERGPGAVELEVGGVVVADGPVGGPELEAAATSTGRSRRGRTSSTSGAFEACAPATSRPGPSGSCGSWGWERRHQPVGGLSRGMQQKVAIAAALVSDPALLLLDEPTIGLDVAASRTVKDWVRRLAAEEHKAVVLTTHQLAVAQEPTDAMIRR